MQKRIFDLTLAILLSLAAVLGLLQLIEDDGDIFAAPLVITPTIDDVDLFSTPINL